nr:head-tail connector protein [Sedimentibacter sp.]
MIVSLQDIKNYLGESGDDSDTIITSLINSAEDELIASTGINLETTNRLGTVERALKIMVWLSFFADRDSSKNTEYLKSERDRLLTKLEWSGSNATT